MDRPTDYQDHPISLASYLFNGPYEYPEFYNSRSQISSLQSSLERMTNLSSINSASQFSPLRVIREYPQIEVGIQTGVSTDIGVLTDSSRINIEVDPSPGPKSCISFESNQKTNEPCVIDDFRFPSREEILKQQENAYKKCCSTATETEDSPQVLESIESSRPERSRYEDNISQEFSLDDLVSEDTPEIQHDLSYSLTANEEEIHESQKKLSDKSIKELNTKVRICKETRPQLQVKIFDEETSKDSFKTLDLTTSAKDSKSFSFEPSNKSSQIIQRKIETIKDSYLDLRPQPKPQHKIQQRSMHSFIPDRNQTHIQSLLNSSSSLKRLFIPTEEQFRTEISPTSSNFLDSGSNLTNSPMKYQYSRQLQSPSLISPMITPKSSYIHSTLNTDLRKRTASAPKFQKAQVEDSYIMRESDLYPEVNTISEYKDRKIQSRVTHSSQTLRSFARSDYIQDNHSDISNTSYDHTHKLTSPSVFKNRAIQTSLHLPSPRTYNHIQVIPTYTSLSPYKPPYHNQYTSTSHLHLQSVRDMSTSTNISQPRCYNQATTALNPSKHVATSTSMSSSQSLVLSSCDQGDAVISIAVHSAKNFYSYSSNSNVRVKVMLELASASAPLVVFSRSLPAREKFGVNYVEDLNVDWSKFKSIYRSQPIIIELWEDFPVKRRVGQTELHIGLLCCSNSSVYGWYNVTRNNDIIGQLLIEVTRKDLPSTNLCSTTHRYFENNTIEDSLNRTKKIQQGNLYLDLIHLNKQLLAGPIHAPSPRE